MHKFHFRAHWAFLLLTVGFLVCYGCKRDVKVPAESNENTVNIRLEAAPENLNPFLTNVAYSIYVAQQIFCNLGNIDPKTLEMMPILVTKIPSAVAVDTGKYKGGYRYDFEIHPTAVWDNGTPVTAADVIFTLKIILHPGLPTQAWATYYDQMREVEVDPSNPKKFTIYFNNYYLLALESLCQFPVMPAYNYDPEGRLAKIPLSDFTDKSKKQALLTNADAVAFAESFKQAKFANDPASIVGCNGYKVVSVGDQGAVLEKKKNWWGDALAANYSILGCYPDKLVYKTVKDEATAVRMLKSGALDIATAIGPQVFLELQKNDTLAARYDFHAYPSTQYARWLFNVRKPELSEVKVRQALAQLVDYQYNLQTVQKNLADRLVSPVLPNKSYYNKNLKPYELNPERAKALLSEAGWKDSNGNGTVDKTIKGKLSELEIDLMYPVASSTNDMIAKKLVETASTVGVKINLIGADVNRISADTKNGNYESAFLGGGLFPGSLDLYARLHSKSLSPNNGDNRNGFINADNDRLIDAIRSTADENKRKELYLEHQALLHEQLPEIYLHAPKQRIVVAKRFDYVLSANRPGFYEALFKLKKNEGVQ